MAQFVDVLKLTIDMNTTQAQLGLRDINKEAMQVHHNMKRMKEQTKKAADDMRGAMFGFGLSVLFGGMAIKNFSQQLLTSMGTVFMELSDSTNGAVKQIMAVQASFNFLKFAIFDTLSETALFTTITEKLIQWSLALADFVQQNPKLAEFMGTVLILGIVLGALGMVLGQLALLAIGLGVSIGMLAGVMILVAVGAAAFASIWLSDIPTVSKIALSLGILILGIMFALSAAGKATVGFAAITSKAFKWLTTTGVGWLVGGFLIVIGTLYNMSQAVGGFANLGALAFGGLLKIIISAGTGMIEFILRPLEEILWAASKLANFLGLGALADLSSQAAGALQSARNFVLTKASDTLTAVDEGGLVSAADIRAANPALQGSDFDVFKAMVSGSTMPGFGSVDTSEAETIRADMEAENDKIQELSGGKSLADLEERQAEANQLLSDIRDRGEETRLAPETMETFSTSLAQKLGPEISRSILRDAGVNISSTER